MVAVDLLVDRVQARASAVNWRKVFLFALMAIPFAVCYVAWYVVKSVGWALAWLYAAGAEGWRYAAEQHAGRVEARGG